MKILLIISLLSLNFVGYSQSDVHIIHNQNKVKYDTLRIKDYSQSLSLWTYSIEQLYKLELRNQDNNKILKLSPNGQTNIGLGFNYKWMGLGIAFKPPFSGNDDDIYGKTKRIDAQFNVFSRSFGMDMSLQYYKGFYVENPKDFIKTWDKEDYPKLSDLETLSMEVSAYYFTNHKKFSYRAAFVRNEVQLKGAGSPIFGVYARTDIANIPGGVIPQDLPDSLKSDFDINGYISNNYGFSFGYTYTFVIWKKFFINLSLVPGFGIKTIKAFTNKGSYIPSAGLSGRIVGRSAIGYEHKYFYLGISQISITNNFSYENLKFSTSTTKVRFFIGKRFSFDKKK